MQFICALYGVTRQAFYALRAAEGKTSIEAVLILALIKEIREDIANLGGRKLLHLLKPRLSDHDISIGRDYLFELLAFHGMLVRRRRRSVRTTNSYHWFHKYPNLLENYEVTGPEQLWVSDITYIELAPKKHSYLSLITDAYSRKIVGYCLHPTLEAAGCVNALEMAISTRTYEQCGRLIHHSDRGVQYCCYDYVDILKAEGIEISMTQSGSPYDNALAERMNCTVKNDYCTGKQYGTHAAASEEIDRIITSYNERRPHQSLNYLTPNQAHKMQGEIAKRWKQYPRKKQPATTIVAEPAEPLADIVKEL